MEESSLLPLHVPSPSPLTLPLSYKPDPAHPPKHRLIPGEYFFVVHESGLNRTGGGAPPTDPQQTSISVNSDGNDIFLIIQSAMVPRGGLRLKGVNNPADLTRAKSQILDAIGSRPRTDSWHSFLEYWYAHPSTNQGKTTTQTRVGVLFSASSDLQSCDAPAPTCFSLVSLSRGVDDQFRFNSQ